MRPALACSLFLASCAGPAATPAPPPPVTIVPAARPPLDPRSVVIEATRAPASLAIDGELAEWGLHSPEPPVATRVAFSLTRKQVAVAAELADRQGGFWLAFRSDAPSVPQPAEYRHASSLPLDCEHDSDGKPLSPKLAAECRQIPVRHKALVAEHERAFLRLVRVDRSDVRMLGPDGALTTVEGARLAWKDQGERATIEASIPLACLPRVAEAPLTQLDLAVRPASGPSTPEIAKDDWRTITLPEPVSFEPFGDLRAALFEWLHTGMGEAPVAVSYWPGTPESVEVFGYAGPHDYNHVVAKTERLFEQRVRMGDVAVGYTTMLWRSWLTVLESGSLVGFYRQPGLRKGLLERDGEVHVFSYDDGRDYGGSMRRYARWDVTAITRESRPRTVIENRDPSQDPWDWWDVKPFASDDLLMFGVRGWGHDASVTSNTGTIRRHGLERTYRWDGAKRRYVEKERRIPLPRGVKPTL